MNNLQKAICDNCGIEFRATFEQLDHTGFITSIRSRSGRVSRIFNFCCYDCEKAFAKRLEKKHPEIIRINKEIDQAEISSFPSYYKERTCALCQTRATLKLSHIIPRFVMKWLRKTSATGFITGKNPNIRVQDSFKMNLLCQECESRFSSWEKYFAENVFRPLQNGARDFSYDERLRKFVISISWRLLRVELYELAADESRMNHAKDALEAWRKYLLDITEKPGSYESHIFFLEPLQTSCEELPPKFPWYAFRGIDGTVLISKNDCISVYTMFPRIAIVSSIHPTVLREWKGTRINKAGKISLAQEVNDPDFTQFLVSRSLRGFKSRVSEERQHKINTAITGDPERFLKSGSFQAFLAEGRIKRKHAAQELNPCITQLVEIIDDCKFDTTLSQDEKNREMFQLHRIANRLIKFSETEAKKTETDMERAIFTSRVNKSDCSSLTDLGELILILLVCPGSAREERVKKIKEELERIEKNRLYPIARDLLAVAFNPSDTTPSFDVGLQGR